MNLRFLILGFLIFIFVLTISFVLSRTSSFVEPLGKYIPLSSDESKNRVPLPRDASGNPITRDASGNILVFDASWAVVPYESPVIVDSHYNPDNFDLTYHEFTPYGDIYNTKLEEITVLDKSGNHIYLPYAKSQNFPVYYDPANTKKADIKSFVPSYTESVLLSNASEKESPISTQRTVSHPHTYNFDLSVHP